MLQCSQNCKSWLQNFSFHLRQNGYAERQKAGADGQRQKATTALGVLSFRSPTTMRWGLRELTYFWTPGYLHLIWTKSSEKLPWVATYCRVPSLQGGWGQTTKVHPCLTSCYVQHQRETWLSLWGQVKTSLLELTRRPLHFHLQEGSQKLHFAEKRTLELQLPPAPSQNRRAWPILSGNCWSSHSVGTAAPTPVHLSGGLCIPPNLGNSSKTSSPTTLCIESGSKFGPQSTPSIWPPWKAAADARFAKDQAEQEREKEENFR